MVELTPKRVSETRLKMAQIMLPNDANQLGKVFGGSILSLIDLTASAVASQFAGHLCVTASFDRVDFHQPVEIGDMVELDGFVSFVGRTSVEVTIDVHAVDLPHGTRRHVNTARVTMVAVNEGRPTPVPRLICETREDRLRFLEGKIRREIRAERTAQMNQLVECLTPMTDAQLDDLIRAESVLHQLRDA